VAIVKLVQVVKAVQYTGSNGAEILAAYPQVIVDSMKLAIDSESGGNLAISFDAGGPGVVAFSTGDWVAVGGGIPSALVGGDYVQVDQLHSPGGA
jgi:hypothetical protein